MYCRTPPLCIPDRLNDGGAFLSCFLLLFSYKLPGLFHGAVEALQFSGLPANDLGQVLLPRAF